MFFKNTNEGSYYVPNNKTIVLGPKIKEEKTLHYFTKYNIDMG